MLLQYYVSDVSKSEIFDNDFDDEDEILVKSILVERSLKELYTCRKVMLNISEDNIGRRVGNEEMDIGRLPKTIDVVRHMPNILYKLIVLLGRSRNIWRKC